MIFLAAPYNHLSGLGMRSRPKQQSLSNNGGEAFYDQEAPDYIRQTAAHWLQSTEDDEDLPIDFVKVEQLAPRKTRDCSWFSSFIWNG